MKHLSVKIKYAVGKDTHTEYTMVNVHESGNSEQRIMEADGKVKKLVDKICKGKDHEVLHWEFV